MSEVPIKLHLGEKMLGRGEERRLMTVIITDEGRLVARFAFRRFSSNLGQAFLWGRDACHASETVIHPDDMVTIPFSGGTPPFTHNTHTIRHGDRQLFVAGTDDEAEAWKTGWAYALKERGLISKSGRLKTTG